jgi:DNA-binding response OmpR family regulator
MQLLLIDDDPELVAVLTLALERAGFGVSAAQDTPTALALLDAEQPALVVLNMPPQTTAALELLHQLRQRSHAAVILLTGRGDEDARVAGLDQGADDYVSKPFSTRELVARIRAILQHHAPVISPPAATLTVGPLTLIEASRTVTLTGRPLVLTPLEFRLLHFLMAHAGSVVPFATLIRQVWGYDDPSATDVVRTSVYRLRRKLKDDPTQPHILQSVPGIGFRLADQPQIHAQRRD